MKLRRSQKLQYLELGVLITLIRSIMYSHSRVYFGVHLMLGHVTSAKK